MLKPISLCLLLALLISSACNNDARKEIEMLNSKGAGLNQTLELNDKLFKLQLMPRSMNHTGNGNRVFRLTVSSKYPQLNEVVNKQSIAYGLDTLFALVEDGDTLRPFAADLIPTGNIKGLEYLVAFPKMDVTGVNNIHFLFNDWLFTHQVLRFQIDPVFIQKIDSLSIIP